MNVNIFNVGLPRELDSHMREIGLEVVSKTGAAFPSSLTPQVVVKSFDSLGDLVNLPENELIILNVDPRVWYSSERRNMESRLDPADYINSCGGDVQHTPERYVEFMEQQIAEKLPDYLVHQANENGHPN